MMLPAPAMACLPPPPGSVEPPVPTVDERARAIATEASAIVYGVLTRSTDDHRGAELRIIHVYKGDLHAGQRVPVKASWGLDPPPCAGMIGPPPPLLKGYYGVFAWWRDPELNAVSEERLAAMFRKKLIAPARGRTPPEAGRRPTP